MNLKEMIEELKRIDTEIGEDVCVVAYNLDDVKNLLYLDEANPIISKNEYGTKVVIIV